MEVLTNKSLFCLQTSGREARLGSLRKDVARSSGQLRLGIGFLLLTPKSGRISGLTLPETKSSAWKMDDRSTILSF